jgi:hypothetical protein
LIINLVSEDLASSHPHKERPRLKKRPELSIRNLDKLHKDPKMALSPLQLVLLQLALELQDQRVDGAHNLEPLVSALVLFLEVLIPLL